jgi:DNA-binding transcriptional MerR regulator
MGALLQIGDVASQTGLTVDTIRFYERERLLHRAARSSGGFRLFSQSDVADLEFIRNAQELGFSLQEIRDLLTLKNTRPSRLRRGGWHHCSHRAGIGSSIGKAFLAACRGRTHAVTVQSPALLQLSFCSVLLVLGVSARTR